MQHTLQVIERLIVSIVVLIGVTDMGLAEEGAGFSVFVEPMPEQRGPSAMPSYNDLPLHRGERAWTIHDREQQGGSFFRSKGAASRDPSPNIGVPFDWTITPRRSPKERTVTTPRGVPWKTTPTWWVNYDLSNSAMPYTFQDKSWWSTLFTVLRNRGVSFRFNLTPDPIIDWEKELGSPAVYMRPPARPARSIGAAK
jgi:hypothetical protein